MKYVLKETEAFAPKWEHCETFGTLEEAQSRMKELYRNNVIDNNPDAIVKAEYNDRSAMCEINDGNEIEWDIQEIQDKKKAFLITTSITTRIIADVDDNNTILDWDKVIEQLKNNIQVKLNNEETGENIDSVVDDTEFPYGSMNGEN